MASGDGAPELFFSLTKASADNRRGQMRLGGESDADSDVLRLAAGVKGRTLRQASACTVPMHACTRLCFCMLFPKHVSHGCVCAADAPDACSRRC